MNDTLVDYLKTQHGFSTVINWSIDSQDWVGNVTDPQYFYDFYKNIADTWSGPVVPLSHEGWSWTPAAMEMGIVPYFQSKGIKILTVAECLDEVPYEIVTGYYGTRDDSWTCDGPFVYFLFESGDFYSTILQIRSTVSFWYLD